MIKVSENSKHSKTAQPFLAVKVLAVCICSVQWVNYCIKKGERERERLQKLDISVTSEMSSE